MKTDKEHEQYVDIGNLYDACLAIRPSSCVNGGTVSIWVKIEDDGYVISSRVQSGEGFSVEARGSNEIRSVRYLIVVLNNLNIISESESN